MRAYLRLLGFAAPNRLRLVAVIAGGRVVEQGRHEDPVARGGAHARLRRAYEGEAPGRARAAAS